MIESNQLGPSAHKVIADLLGLDAARPFTVSQAYPEPKVEGTSTIHCESRVYWPEREPAQV